MKTKTLMFVVAVAAVFQLTVVTGRAQERVTFTEFPNLQADAYMYRDTCQSLDGRLPGFTPFFVVYPDKACDADQAADLIVEMGMGTYLHDFSGMVLLINPVGEKYDAVKDFEVYKELINSLRVISNLKVIGIGDGATFVNEVIAKHASPVAGIATIGGKSSKFSEEAAPVPAFIAGDGSTKVATSYIWHNAADEVDSFDGLTFYANEDEPLQQVVVSQKKYDSLKDTFADAWKYVLSKNYRYNNFQHTWYMGCDFGQYGPYELEPYIMLDELGVTRNVVVKNLLGTGDFLWYEYFPEATLTAEKGTVPLVILLHGNTNDPRTQAETSGFIELCAKENFAVAELEWQGGNFTPMGVDGIEQVVYYLLNTYPQLDASRVYAEGLSAGSATATTLGIRKSHIFAAVGAQSAGVFRGMYAFGSSGDALMNEALQKRGWVETAYFSISGGSDQLVPFVNAENWETNGILGAWQTYQTMNGMDVTVKPDFGKDEVFGIEMADREKFVTNKHIIVDSGTICKEGIPLIKAVYVNEYGHWNFKPGAQMMWDYFKHFSRDPETKKLAYHE